MFSVWRLQNSRHQMLKPGHQTCVKLSSGRYWPSEMPQRENVKMASASWSKAEGEHEDGSYQGKKKF